MDRHQFDTDDREGLVAQLAEERVRAWVRLLLAGDKRATNDLHNLVLERLAEADAKALFVQAATQEDGDISFAVTVRNLIKDRCQAEAEDQVAGMERRRAESHDDDRIERASWARAMH